MKRRVVLIGLAFIAVAVLTLLVIEVQINSSHIYANAMQRYEYGDQTSAAEFAIEYPITLTASAP